MAERKGEAGTSDKPACRSLPWKNAPIAMKPPLKRDISRSGPQEGPLMESPGSHVRITDRIDVVFLGCTGPFWDKVLTNLSSESGLEWECAFDQKALEERSGARRVVVLGVSSKDATDQEIDVLAENVARIKSSEPKDTRILCVVPKNGDLPRRLTNMGADDVINTSDVDTADWSQCVGEIDDRIRNLKNSFDGQELLSGAIVCSGAHGSNGDLERRRLESLKTMRDFAGHYELDAKGNLTPRAKYIHHMKTTGHEAARDYVTMQLRDWFGERILDVGCGEGHPIRYLTRNVFIQQIMEGTRSRADFIGVDMLDIMVDHARRGFKKLTDQNRKDAKKGESIRVIPELIDMRFICEDFLYLDANRLENVVMGSKKHLRMFGRPDTVKIEYVAHWIDPERRPLLAQKASEAFAPGEEGYLILIEEFPLKVTPSVFMKREEAEAISRNTWPMPDPDYYYGFYEREGFTRVLKEPVRAPIDGPEDPEPHSVYGMVMRKGY